VRFSVLLPTRDRLELLQLAIASVRTQDYDDWEVVVSDNVSKQDVASYVASLADARIRYVRTPGPISVTDNWNYALRASTGDYVIMLGDDDALARGCLSRLAAVIASCGPPEVIYVDALQYAYPNVFPDRPGAFVRRGYTEFLRNPRARVPFWLEPAYARELVRATMSFRIAFGFNMQHFVVSRTMIDQLSRDGDFYRSPYPDYYAANALFLVATKMLAVPESLVVIGISPRSFGYFFVNQREDQGDSFLNNAPDQEMREKLRSIILPGTTLLSSWLYAIETLRAAIPAARDLPIDYQRYRLLQIHATFTRAGLPGVKKLLPLLRPTEIAAGGLLGGLMGLARLVPGALGDALTSRLRDRFALNPPFDLQIRDVPYRNILELVESS
jgi:glycosyltransferase involved in cell wall biosynthesis